MGLTSTERLEDIPDGALVTLDSAPIIYYLQDHPRFAQRFSTLFDAVAEGKIFLNVSTITLAEVMAGPLSADNEILAAQYREVLCHSPGWQTVSVDENIAAEAARLRARYRLRLPDAIQVATAIVTRSWALVTHDSALTKVKDIRVLGVG
jgi:predicted nucleic acid-binding protein